MGRAFWLSGLAAVAVIAVVEVAAVFVLSALGVRGDTDGQVLALVAFGGLIALGVLPLHGMLWARWNR